MEYDEVKQLGRPAQCKWGREAIAEDKWQLSTPGMYKLTATRAHRCDLGKGIVFMKFPPKLKWLVDGTRRCTIAATEALPRLDPAKHIQGRTSLPGD